MIVDNAIEIPQILLQGKYMMLFKGLLIYSDVNNIIFLEFFFLM